MRSRQAARVQIRSACWCRTWPSTNFCIVVALSCLLLAKVAHVTVPIVLKWIVDDMSASGVARAIVVVPVLLLVAYGIARFSVTLFTGSGVFFAKVTQRAVRRIALETFEHL